MVDDGLLAGGIVRVSDPLDEPSSNARSAAAASRANRREPPFHSTRIATYSRIDNTRLP